MEAFFLFDDRVLVYDVTSESDFEKFYRVEVWQGSGRTTCDCMDHKVRGRQCKHIMQVLVATMQEVADVSPEPRALAELDVERGNVVRLQGPLHIKLFRPEEG